VNSACRYLGKEFGLWRVPDGFFQNAASRMRVPQVGLQGRRPRYRTSILNGGHWLLPVPIDAEIDPSESSGATGMKFGSSGFKFMIEGSLRLAV
jgi:hypothetical protein